MSLTRKPVGGRPESHPTLLASQSSSYGSAPKRPFSLIRSLAAKRRKRRQLRKVDFSSDILEFHLHQNNPKKIYRFPGTTFKLAVPKFDELYQSDAGKYTIKDMHHIEFERLLHWIIFRSVRSNEAEMLEFPNRRGELYQFQDPQGLFLFHLEAEKLSLPALQNALTHEMIDTVVKFNKKPSDVALCIYLKLAYTKNNGGTSQGLAKLCLGLLVARDVGEHALQCFKDWASDHTVSRQLFIDLAIGLAQKKSRPWETDRSQYYLPLAN